MKTISTITLVVLLFLSIPGELFALMSIEQVTKERAKKLGVELRIKPNGPNEVWVELEFRARGELKDFEHVSVEIRDGEKFLLGYTPLKSRVSDSDRVHVGFLANREFLEKVTLRIVTGQIGNNAGRDFRVKDFVDLEKSK